MERYINGAGSIYYSPLFNMKNCSYCTTIDDSYCNSVYYLDSLGFRDIGDDYVGTIYNHIESICISNASKDDTVNGIYEYVGCESGLPACKHIDDD